MTVGGLTLLSYCHSTVFALWMAVVPDSQVELMWCHKVKVTQPKRMFTQEKDGKKQRKTKQNKDTRTFFRLKDVDQSRALLLISIRSCISHRLSESSVLYSALYIVLSCIVMQPVPWLSGLEETGGKIKFWWTNELFRENMCGENQFSSLQCTDIDINLFHRRSLMLGCSSGLLYKYTVWSS